MRQAMNFRFSPNTIAILSKLEEELHTSKTHILEQALYHYAKRKLASFQSLLKFAGKLSTKDADIILKTIKVNRKNKHKEINL